MQQNSKQKLPLGHELGIILAVAAIVTVVGTLVLQAFGRAPSGFGPVAFFGTAAFIKLGLFAFWPTFSKTGWLDAAALFSADRRRRPHRLALWNQKDPRLDMSLFNGNVPTFVLSAEQTMLDWNPAFDMIFGKVEGVRRGVHISAWFDLLDNFRNVAKRSAKLYGEGVLPITDRERVTYLSAEYGRMVFTKVMTPIVERTNGKIIGWNVVLNINSVNKRQEFFAELFSRIQENSRLVRYVAAYDGIFGQATEFQRLLALHRAATAGARQVLDIATGTGALALELERDGIKVTAVDEDTERLRQLKFKAEVIGSAIRIVRRNHNSFGKTPVDRFDAMTLMLGLDRFSDPVESLSRLAPALKPGGIISVSALVPGADSEAVMALVKAELEASGEFEKIKTQFGQVQSFEKDRIQGAQDRLYSAEDVQKILQQAGFTEILEVVTDVWGGQGVFVTARRPL